MTSGGTGLYAAGRVSFNGTATAPITVRGKNGAPYPYVYLYGSGANGSALHHVTVRNSTYGIQTTSAWDVLFDHVTGTENTHGALKLGGGSATVRNGNFYGNAYHGLIASDGAFVQVFDSQFHDNLYDGLSVSRYSDVRFGDLGVRGNSSVVNNHRNGLDVYYGGYVKTGWYYGSGGTYCDPSDPSCGETFEGGWVDLHGNGDKNVNASTGAVVWAELVHWNAYDRASIDPTIRYENPAGDGFVDYFCIVYNWYSHSCSTSSPPPTFSREAETGTLAAEGGVEVAASGEPSRANADRRARAAFWSRVRRLIESDPARAEAELRSVIDTSPTEQSRATVLLVGLLSKRDSGAAKRRVETDLAGDLAGDLAAGAAGRFRRQPGRPEYDPSALDAPAVTVLAKRLFYAAVFEEHDAAKAERVRALLAAYGDEDAASGLLQTVMDQAFGVGALVEEGTARAQTVPSEPAAFGATAFPNPFRDAATIRYTLPEASAVTLAVYDALGRRVATLVAGPVGAGVHEARLAAGALPSGLYVYRLDAAGRTLRGPMTLAR